MVRDKTGSCDVDMATLRTKPIGKNSRFTPTTETYFNEVVPADPTDATLGLAVHKKFIRYTCNAG